jgi:outer membrane protein assembly factor BamE
MHIPGVYKIDVPQGNIVTQEMVNQLHTGMNKHQVSYAMGTPLVVDVFHPDRWDYIYSFQQGGHKPEQHHVTLYFENDQLTRIEGDYQPQPGSVGTAPAKETTVTVTPPPTNQGFFSRLFGSKKKATTSPSN